MVEEKWRHLYHTHTHIQRFQDNIFEGGGEGVGRREWKMYII